MDSILSFNGIRNIANTVRYLRPVQIYGRIWQQLFSPRVDASPAPAIRHKTQPLIQTCVHDSSLIKPWRFRFLNKEGEVGRLKDWNTPDQSKLWLYNLHYFDDLNAQGAEQRVLWHQQLIDRWVVENPPPSGNGWEPYPTSLRIINWIKWALKGNELDASWSNSLAVQARWLRSNLEWHLLGNHLLVNAKALVFAGAFFEGEEAKGWLDKGLRILQQELPEQVLLDGGHFERSPMYHSIILEDFLDLLNISKVFPELFHDQVLHQWRDAVQRMRRWLKIMSHPDGRISFFNDAAFGIAAETESLETYADGIQLPHVGSVTEGATELSDSGYIRLQRGEAIALLDVAPVGPDYLPGHAHADTLSFELSLLGKRLLVNSGTSEYGLGKERLRQRGTAAHTTVTINGKDSSEVWGGFRVARRAYPYDLTCSQKDDVLSVRCSHDGYRRLPGKPVHQREWRLSENKLTIIDRINGKFEHAFARYYLHPNVQVVQFSSLSSGEFRIKGMPLVQWQLVGGQAQLLPSTYHPEFGVSIPTNCIEVTFTGSRCEMVLIWKSSK